MAVICERPALAIAQSDDAVSISPVIVSGSHIPTAAEALPASTTVITRQDIEARRPASVVELLRFTPGLHIDQPGGRGGISSVYLRGADPNFTLVLIDGIEVNDPTNTRGGSFDLSSLAVADIERIEIIRGPLSSVYGSDALAGVINIVTRRPTEQRTYTVQGGIGTEGYHQANAAARGPLLADDELGYALSANYVDDGEPVEGSEFIGKAFTANFSSRPTDDLSALLTTRYADTQSESFPDQSGGPLFALLRDVDQRDAEEFSVGIDLKHELSSVWNYRVQASWYNRQEQASSPGIALDPAASSFAIPPFSSDSNFDRGRLGLTALYSLSDAIAISVGADARVEEGASSSVLVFDGTPSPGRFDLDRGLYGYFAEARYTTPRGLALQAGMRIDDPEGFDTEVSPRVGFLYPFNAGRTIVRGNWGEGFKLPSFFALGNPIVGNPDLQPESSRGFDLGLEQSLGTNLVLASVTGFRNRFFNLIDSPPPTFQLVNRSAVTTQGVEVGLSLRPASTVVIDSYATYTETNIEDSADELRNRPEWRASITTSWAPRPQLLVSLGILHVGEAFDSSIPTGDGRLDDYERVDVSGTWRFASGLRVSLAVDNLLGAEYQEAIGFPAPGTRVRFSAGLDL